VRGVFSSTTFSDVDSEGVPPDADGIPLRVLSTGQSDKPSFLHLFPVLVDLLDFLSELL